MTKGFTLIELLIVIGILAILATTVVLVLNPAQLLAETRDTQRISDLDTMRSAINLYLTTASSPDLDGASVGAGVCTTNWMSSNAGGLAITLNPFTTGAGSSPALSATPRAVDGSGWLPVPLSAIPGGAPLAALPVDPNPDTTVALNDSTANNVGGRFYAYQCNNTAKTYEINANFESTKYNNFNGATGAAATGPETSDGGGGTNNTYVYEVGNAAGLGL